MTPPEPSERAAPTVAAPLLEALLRTSTAHRSGSPADELSTLESAQSWLSRTLPPTRQTGSAVHLRRADLEPLRALRETLRQTLRADRPRAQADTTEFDASVQLRWSRASGLDARPLKAGWEAVASLITVELVIADANGTLPRIKTCARSECGYPFIDHSRNVSRMWHDADTCGNIINLRASRARKTAPATPTAPPSRPADEKTGKDDDEPHPAPSTDSGLAQVNG
jgi:predicted RNA-binding Zn ribbon-like protein